ncbi:SHKBP1 [Symbiodinium sp. KB8]|nr:SHKBP1 [Symbiodinium sp. KB8]
MRWGDGWTSTEPEVGLRALARCHEYPRAGHREVAPCRRIRPLPPRARRVHERDSCHIVARLLDDPTSGPSLPRCLSSSPVLSTFSATLASKSLPSPTCPRIPPLSLQTPTSLSTALEAGSGPLPVLSMIAPPTASAQCLTFLPLPCLSLFVFRSPRGSHCLAFLLRAGPRVRIADAGNPSHLMNTAMQPGHRGGHGHNRRARAELPAASGGASAVAKYGRAALDGDGTVNSAEVLKTGPCCVRPNLLLQQCSRCGSTVGKMQQERALVAGPHLVADAIRFGPEAVAFLLRGCARPCSVPPYTVGRACWLWRRNACWLTRCLIFFLSADLFATGVQWSVCRKQRLELHAVFCEVSVLHARVQGCSSLVRGKTAGNRRSFVEASRGKDPAEQGLVAINIGGAGKGKTKETGADGFGGREGEQGLGTPAATNLKRKDNKPARHLCERRYSKLRAAPERESICVDLDTAIIEALGVDVEVAHQKIAGNCSPSLAANTGSSTLESRGKQRGGHREGRQDGGRQAAASRGNGKRSRRSNKARKTGESKVASCEFGVSRLLDAQRCTVNCCECPVRANGDTSVASQQSAAPLAGLADRFPTWLETVICTSPEADMRSPRAVAWVKDTGALYVADMSQHCVWGCTPGQVPGIVAGQQGLRGGSAGPRWPGDGCDGRMAALEYPHDVALSDDEMTLYVCELYAVRALDLTRQPPTMRTVFQSEYGLGGIAFSTIGQCLVVAVHSGHLLLEVPLNETGNEQYFDGASARQMPASFKVVAGTGQPGPLVSEAPALHAAINNPLKVKVSKTGDIIFLEAGNRALRMLERSTGKLITLSSAVDAPDGLALTPQGTAFIAEGRSSEVLQFRPSSSIEWNWGTCAGTGESASLPLPRHLIPNTAGVWPGLGKGQVYGPALAAQLARPQGLCWVPGYGLLICDVQCHAIFLVRRVDPWAWHRAIAVPRALAALGRATLAGVWEAEAPAAKLEEHVDLRRRSGASATTMMAQHMNLDRQVLLLLLHLPDEEFRRVLSFWGEADGFSVECRALEEERRGLAEELRGRQLRIEEERSALGYDQERLQILTGHREPEDDLIALNVGGEVFTTRRSTLCVFDDSYLSNLFSGRWEASIEKDSGGRYFLDFDPVCFRLLLNILRTKRFESQRAPFPLPKVPPEKEEQFWHLVEYFGLTEAFQEVEAAAAASAAARRPKANEDSTSPSQPALGASLMQSAGALLRTLRQAAGEPPGPGGASEAHAPPAVAGQAFNPDMTATVTETQAFATFPTTGPDEFAAVAEPQRAAPEVASTTTFISAASQPSASGPATASARTPGWSRKVAHRLAAVEEDMTTLHISSSRAAASAAAARASRGFRAGCHTWELKVLLCSDWSYVGLVSEEWTSLTVPIGRADHSWGIASGGALFACGREIGRIQGYGSDSCLRWVVDMDTRTASVAIDDRDLVEVFVSLPTTVFPAASNCRAPARYSITFLGETTAG